MPEITLRELTFNDKAAFIEAMKLSSILHTPWVKAPQTSDEFDEYYQRSQQSNSKSFIAPESSLSILRECPANHDPTEEIE